MTCQELKNFIENTLPGERDSTALAEAHQHALTCPACAAALSDMLRLEEELTRLCRVEADERLTETVMSRIASLSSSRAGWRAHWDLLGVTFMVAGAVILAALYWWTTDWSDGLTSLLQLSTRGSWTGIAVRGGDDTICSSCVGLAAIEMAFHPLLNDCARR
jgi:hypothetical protein